MVNPSTDPPDKLRKSIMEDVVMLWDTSFINNQGIYESLFSYSLGLEFTSSTKNDSNTTNSFIIQRFFTTSSEHGIPSWVPVFSVFQKIFNQARSRNDISCVIRRVMISSSEVGASRRVPYILIKLFFKSRVMKNFNMIIINVICLSIYLCSSHKVFQTGRGYEFQRVSSATIRSYVLIIIDIFLFFRTIINKFQQATVRSNRSSHVSSSSYAINIDLITLILQTNILFVWFNDMVGFSSIVSRISRASYRKSNMSNSVNFVMIIKRLFLVTMSMFLQSVDLRIFKSISNEFIFNSIRFFPVSSAVNQLESQGFQELSFGSETGVFLFINRQYHPQAIIFSDLVINKDKGAANKEAIIRGTTNRSFREVTLGTDANAAGHVDGSIIEAASSSLIAGINLKNGFVKNAYYNKSVSPDCTGTVPKFKEVNEKYNFSDVLCRDNTIESILDLATYVCILRVLFSL